MLQQQKLTRADFDLAMETNTYLRKIANAFNGHLLIGFDVPPAKGKPVSRRRKLARV